MKKWIDKGYAVYRRLLYSMCGRPKSGVLSSWIPCQVEDPSVRETFGDVVHPCVRFIEEGFEGHRWWMVYTPYYGGNARIENPRLCYSDASVGVLPIDWKYYCTIMDQPEEGYNSDPTLLFEGGRMYVYWRENYTPSSRSLGMSRATFGCCVENQRVHYLPEAQLVELNRHIDKELSPTFISFRGHPRAYSLHFRFCSKLMYHFSNRLSRYVYHLLDYTAGINVEVLAFGKAIPLKGSSDI